MTKEEILARLAEGYTSKLDLTWPQFVSAVSAAGAQTKTEIMLAVNSRNGPVLFNIIDGLSYKKRREVAKSIVDGMAADDLFSVEDLETILQFTEIPIIPEEPVEPPVEPPA